MTIQRLFITFLLTLLFLATQATQIVRINLFNQYPVNKVVFYSLDEKYQIETASGKVFRIKKNNTLYITAIGNTIRLKDNHQLLGNFKKIKVNHTSSNGLCKLETLTPDQKIRIFNGDFVFKATKNQLDITNITDLNSYLAGVVEAEAGPNAPYEFYKSQAIISRTYFLSLVTKMGTEKYRLSDDVNHQVYKGVSVQNPLILQAVKHTSGLVIVDTSKQLITAAFHSNSGGQTLNSEDVWLSAKSYLKATTDPYSLNQTNTQWTDTILLNRWIDFLYHNGIKPDSINIKNFYQDTRKKYYQVGNDTISLRKIREYFNLRSTWFSVEIKNNQAILNGRGYGHGVGLSQEGAMEMARQNFSFIDIIHFYYQNVKVINYNLLVRNW